MSVDTLCKLKSALHINIDYLLFGEQKALNDLNSIKILIETCPSDKRTFFDRHHHLIFKGSKITSKLSPSLVPDNLL